VRIEVTAFATLARFLPADSTAGTAHVDLAAGSRVADVTRVLGIPAAVPVVVLVNGRDAGPADTLNAGDALTLFPPLAGGVS
jgi:molybdopterin converting factor small subunit